MTAIPPSNGVLVQLEMLMVAGAAISCVSFFGRPRIDFLRHLILLLGNAAVIRWNLGLTVITMREDNAWSWLVPTSHGGGVGLVEVFAMGGASGAAGDYDLTFSFLAVRWCGFIGLILLCIAFTRELVAAFRAQRSSRPEPVGAASTPS